MHLTISEDDGQVGHRAGRIERLLLDHLGPDTSAVDRVTIDIARRDDVTRCWLKAELTSGRTIVLAEDGPHAMAACASATNRLCEMIDQRRPLQVG